MMEDEPLFINDELLPSKEIVGVDKKFLRLSATISSEIYDATSRKQFETRLKAIDPLNRDFPDLSVRFLEKGITVGRNFPETLSSNPPTFAAVITGSTLILCWRGSTTLRDVLASAVFGSKVPWQNKGLRVQGVYFDYIEGYFKNHAQDVINYIDGNYSKEPNRTATDGTPITKIILTGHSLGGGLAQVAHLFMTVPDNYDLAEKVKGVDLRTVAFSAPMTIIDNQDDEATTTFIKAIEPNMRNLFFNADIVPRIYGNLKFVSDCAEAFVKEQQLSEPVKQLVESESAKRIKESSKQFADALVLFNKWILEQSRDKIKEAESYRHIGKLIYYKDASSEPAVYVDTGGDSREDPKLDQKEDSFYALEYGPKTKVVTTVWKYHSVMVTGVAHK